MTSVSMTPHREPAEAVVAVLGFDAQRGLGRAEAARRLDQFGPNRLKSAPETPWWRRLIEQFQNVKVHPVGRHRVRGDRVGLPGSARDRAALRRDRYSGDRRHQRRARVQPGGAGGKVDPGADGARRPRIERGPRWRAQAHSGPYDRARRHSPDRSGGQDPGRHPGGRKRQSPDRRSRLDRREPAGCSRAGRNRTRPTRPMRAPWPLPR
ncbi:MAG: hypothetical protein EXR02_06805 [Rhodospirillales bacterium]|nr:hypothetical protein [Rhodospirillales bacterium]